MRFGLRAPTAFLLRSLLAVLAACGGGGDGGGSGQPTPPQLSYTGPVGQPIPARVLDDLFIVDARVGDAPSGPRLVVDTGSPFIHVGFFIASTGGADRPVDQVVPGTDAESQGVRVGDVLHAIDGVPLNGMSGAEITDKLRGPVGSTHAYEFGCATCSGFMGTRTIAVEDLLPLPN